MLKKILLTILAALVGLALLWVLLGWLGVALPAGALSSYVEQELSEDLAPMRIALKGPLRIVPAWGLDLRASDIELINPEAKGGSRTVARVARLDLLMSLSPLLWGEVDVQRVRARRLELDLVPNGTALTFPLVEGGVTFSERLIRLTDMLIELGDSRLQGNALLAAGKPPRLVVHLDSPRADLEDIYAVVGLGRPTGAQALAQSRGQLLKSIDQAVRSAFGAIEGEITLTARELRLRGAVLGKARLKLSLKGERLVLDPLLIELPGGSIQLSDEVVRQGDRLASELNLSVRNFSYGILARHHKNDPRAGGKISLRIALTSAAPSMPQFMAHANGLIQVGIWPKDLHEEAYSLWAANLVFGLLRSLVSHYESKVNCAIADLVLQKGVLKQRKLIIDTSNIRVSGEAKIDFTKKTIDVHLTPRAKTPQFFSLETPITIDGTFADFSAGVAPGGLVGSVINFATSPIFAPLRRLFGDTLPEEGKDVCMNPETWPPPITQEGQAKTAK
ncbi:MAG: AsmA-like C-terminal region-containing protein [Desulfarculaceae bacterium]|nr:AsmA-like C-terminal region-containing protein [Desulfarculaceae bacterium]MCF8073595.1 AsmA-like C-terminal region-containing protein [Desulfarculaceae bacterium]MCF8103752.1 AsmA-like C-terminal region-containing protein [Desulfarculaceae bacterium]MCF8115689.1 AsmA-like C-terminal region-containing protein [Desulfarculaceae bacterium]